MRGVLNFFLWNSHIDKISSKANKVLGLIKRSCRDLRDVSTLRTLYCTLVRSQLEYGSVVWSPFTARNITKLERVQHRTTKFILKTDKFTLYPQSDNKQQLFTGTRLGLLTDIKPGFRRATDPVY